nr:SDR family NAD(P)-dependent oxidoreductase [Saccharothrix yanglingensis]
MTRTAVVTGGGTGIGRAVAEELVRRGLDVVVTGRRADVPTCRRRPRRRSARGRWRSTRPSRTCPSGSTCW